MVIFSVGVLMIMSLTTSLSSRFQSNTLRTTLSIVGQGRLDSIAALEYDSVSVGSAMDTLNVSNETYTCTMTVTQTDPVSRTVQVSLDPLDGTGPRFDGTVYVARIW
jgi:hypothetical protein